MDENIQFLRHQPFFAGLNEAALKEVARYMTPRKISRGEHILMQDEPAHSLYFVVHGQVRIYHLSPSGREQAIMDVYPGQVFNVVPMIDGRPSPASAVARTNGLLYGLSRHDFLYLMHKYPTIMEAALIYCAGRLRHLTGLVEDLALRTVSQRLARLLLQLADEATPAPQRFTHQELASQLGTVREVISRTLREFEREGLITIDRHRIVITDKERLVALANQE